MANQIINLPCYGIITDPYNNRCLECYYLSGCKAEYRTLSLAHRWLSDPLSYLASLPPDRRIKERRRQYLRQYYQQPAVKERMIECRVQAEVKKLSPEMQEIFTKVRFSKKAGK